MSPKPLIEAADVRAVTYQMQSMWVGRGRRVLELEQRMAAWVGAKYAVAFGSGTAALTVALMHAGRPVIRPDKLPGCDVFDIAVRTADLRYREQSDLHITVYPERGDQIEDFARHLPREGETRLIGRFGVFSFGALKDVTGGIGGCLVAQTPFTPRIIADWKRLSPLSDINAALILSQLDRYDGHTRLRQVADGKTWESPA